MSLDSTWDGIEIEQGEFFAQRTESECLWHERARLKLKNIAYYETCARTPSTSLILEVVGKNQAADLSSWPLVLRNNSVNSSSRRIRLSRGWEFQPHDLNETNGKEASSSLNQVIHREYHLPSSYRQRQLSYATSPGMQWRPLHFQRRCSQSQVPDLRAGVATLHTVAQRSRCKNNHLLQCSKSSGTICLRLE